MSARNTLKEYEAKLNECNFDLLLPLISKDCKFWFTSGTFSGHEETRKAFEKTWSMIKDETYWLTNLEWLAESDQAAVCTYTFNWKGIINDQAMEGKGRGTSCLRNEHDTWKIVHEHLSHFPK